MTSPIMQPAPQWSAPLPTITGNACAFAGIGRCWSRAFAIASWLEARPQRK